MKSTNKFIRYSTLFLASFILVVSMVVMFTGCGEITTNGSEADVDKTLASASRLQSNQPTPTDIDYSLERYNLIRRAYWVNGQREKANTLPCAVTKPLGYITLFTESGAIVGNFVVDGKVSSLNSFLTPDSEYYDKNGGSSTIHTNNWLADVDGSYGENDAGIFFFDTMGNYIEWTGIYLYTDIPMKVSDPVIEFDINYNLKEIETNG